MSALWCRSDSGVGRERVCVSALWRRSFHGVCRGNQKRLSPQECKGRTPSQECRESVSSKCVLQECQVRASHRSVK